MPSLQTVDLSSRARRPDEMTPLENFSSSFFNRRQELDTEQRETDALKKIYDKYRNEGQDLDSAILEIQTAKGLSPTARVNAANTVINLKKTNAELQKNQQELIRKAEAEDKKRAEKQKKDEDARQKKLNEKQSVYEIYKDIYDDEEAKRRSEFDSVETAKANRSAYLTANKPEKPAALTPFERTYQNEEAKKLIKYEEEIPKVEDSLKNLDRVEYLFDNELSGPKGYLKAAFDTESAAEARNLAFTAIDGIIKLFNPVGPIPVQKLKIIQNQFQINPSDLKSTAKGKIAALRTVTTQALNRAKQRSALIRKYQGAVPPEELQKFDQESAQLQDVLFDQSAFNIKMKEAKDDDLVEGFYSKDGKKLKPIPKKEAQKLYDQGVITNVPPG